MDEPAARQEQPQPTAADMEAANIPTEPVMNPKERDDQVLCTVCTEIRPKTALIEACQSCTAPRCKDCLAEEFSHACNDLTRMPPRCCGPLRIGAVLPLLESELAARFKERYEERSAKDPVYCPVPTCSAFIPLRHLPAQAPQLPATQDQGPATFDCTRCSAHICLGCKQLAHDDAPCTSSATDLDEETEAWMAKYGYKRCPKCRAGVKRMFGCSHMMCLCGAQWCWNCLRAIDDCDRSMCDDEESEHEDWDEEDEVEPVPCEDDEVEPVPCEDDEVVPVLCEDDEEKGDDASESEERTIRSPGEEPPQDPSTTTADAALPDVADPPRPHTQQDADAEAERQRRRLLRENLDARPIHFWNDQGFDFGDEPDSNHQTRSWACSHKFGRYSVKTGPNWTSCPLKKAGSPRTWEVAFLAAQETSGETDTKVTSEAEKGSAGTAMAEATAYVARRVDACQRCWQTILPFIDVAEGQSVTEKDKAYISAVEFARYIPSALEVTIGKTMKEVTLGFCCLECGMRLCGSCVDTLEAADNAAEGAPQARSQA